jgi:plastocyanin
MKRLGLAFIPLMLLAMVVVVGCGKPAATTSGGGNTVSMDASNFAIHAITIKAGTALKFDDSSGGYHVICLGKDQVCDQSAQGPSELMGQGFTINAPDTKSVVFANAGTYDVTCTVHPEMNVTVTVTA